MGAELTLELETIANYLPELITLSEQFQCTGVGQGSLLPCAHHLGAAVPDSLGREPTLQESWEFGSSFYRLSLSQNTVEGLAQPQAKGTQCWNAADTTTGAALGNSSDGLCSWVRDKEKPSLLIRNYVSSFKMRAG